VQTIISEVGTDMSRFPTGRPFCAWLGLAPHNAISGSHTRSTALGRVTG
jgi:transposase